MGTHMEWRVLYMSLCVILVGALERPCTFTDSAGNYYDLSPLSTCNGTGYQNDGFQINICNSVKGNCDSTTSVCQLGDNDSAGSANNFTFSDYKGSEKGVVVNFGSGTPDGCPGNLPRQSTITFICDPTTKGEPNITFIGEKPTCFYHLEVRSVFACPIKPGQQIVTCPIYVHLVPHTHDDVGWIVTPDEYYESEVKYILNTVVSSLSANPQRKFIYVEQAFFWRWWMDPNTTTTQRNTFMQVYKNGQFEFVIGGWVMQDEACTTYGANIDQMTVGHQFLLDTFGARPTKGWQIDPFGASSVTPTLNKLSGFNGHVIDRVSNKQSFQTAETMQFMWQGSPSLSNDAIFTEILDTFYCDWLLAFDFSNDPVTPANVQSYANTFYDMVEARTENFRTNNILAQWGCDFAFQNATAMFHSMDILVSYLQQNTKNNGVHVNYTLLSDYFDAVWAAGEKEDVQWPQNSGSDFFPLFESLYWTGYYTSRTQLKGIVRQGEAAARTAEQIFAIGREYMTPAELSAQYANISVLRRANAEAQHHDGVTGTSEPDVVLNFGNNVLNGVQASYTAIQTGLSSILSMGKTPSSLNYNSSSLLNIQPGQIIAVVLWNSLGWMREDIVRLPVNTNTLSVFDFGDAPVEAQINPATSGNDLGKFNLYFQTDIPALGFSTYFISAAASKFTYLANVTKVPAGSSAVLENSYLTITISGETGRISNVTNKNSSLSVDVDQNILQYTSLHSGAYAFSPAGAASPLSASKRPQTTLYVGPLVTEAYQIFACDLNASSSYAQQTIRLPQAPNKARFSTSINSEHLFFTDDNGFEFLEREYSFMNLIEGNYYPMIYSSYIQDSTAQLTVVAERSHGVSSLDNGQFEVMIHRNPDMTDNFGPGLTDTTIVYPTLRVILDTPQESRLAARVQPYILNFPLVPFFGPAKSVLAWNETNMATYTFLNMALPPNVHLLSLNALNTTSNKFIVRLAHLFAVGEDPIYSKPATVDLTQLLTSEYFKIASITETTLTANNAISTTPIKQVTLTPKQIRTFIIEFASSLQ